MKDLGLLGWVNVALALVLCGFLLAALPWGSQEPEPVAAPEVVPEPPVVRVRTRPPPPERVIPPPGPPVMLGEDGKPFRD